MPPKGQKREADAVKKVLSDEEVSPTKQIKGNQNVKTKSSSSSLSELLTEKEWKEAMAPEFSKDYFKKLEASVMTEYASGVQVFPPVDLIFNALVLTPLNKVKVVLIGQDPYHDDGQAMGLAFSVPKDIKVPPSLRNMYTELSTDIPGFKDPGHGCLEKWAKQGVLLLNATLTVQAHKPNSHSKFGWQTFTDAVIKTISEKCQGVVFMLWGNFAHKKEKLVDSGKHSVLKFAHPSPLSFGKFKGCKCFSQVNSSLATYGKKEIDWTL